ncbi:hypothetical protein THRCLA_07564 [Thraustotheca clavata]|uniref:peptidylprolyl isomerase n=1 Tax=Thraustotheca clavata TaxID=74557 RepID=A0A1V9ZCS3_9STRA|nr:hypothetical protein THRCLA_07564 [Thraustotheca clavata]
MALQAEQAKQKAKACCANPKLVITYLWFVILFFAMMFCLGAIVFAANNNNDGIQYSKSLGFAGIWMMFLVIGLSLGGTLVMRKYASALAVGFFIGVVIMMAFNMLSLSVLCSGAAYLARLANNGTTENNVRGPVHSDEASAVFSFFMFVLYSIFAVVLIKHRAVVIKEGVSTDLPDKMAPVAPVSPKVAKLDEVTKTSAPPVKDEYVELETVKPGYSKLLDISCSELINSDGVNFPTSGDTLGDGTLFDSTRNRGRTYEFLIGGNQVIQGLDEGIRRMSKGQIARLRIPPLCGYGEHGYPPIIPPNATLYYEVELLVFTNEQLS